MTVLLIDTSTERGVTGLCKGNELIWGQELPMGFQTAQHLLPTIQEGLKLTGTSPQDLTAIAVGCGPGSYTGIRVGVMIAQAMAFALNIPLIGLSSLDLFTPSDSKESFAVVIDAKIGGLYLKLAGEVPRLCSIEEASTVLSQVKLLLTPTAEPLRSRLQAFGPQNSWQWLECAPSLTHFAQLAHQQKNQKNAPIEILYLRKTQAEIEKEQKDRLS